METSNIVALTLGCIGFVISIVGFVVTPILNLKSKRLEKRLEYRFLLFQRVIQLWDFFHSNRSSNYDELKPLILAINKDIQLYGYSSEIKSFRDAVNSYNKLAEEYNEENRQKVVLKFNAFLSISFNAYRKEIVLDKLLD